MFALVLCMPDLGLGWSLARLTAGQRRPKHEASRALARGRVRVRISSVSAVDSGRSVPLLVLASWQAEAPRKVIRPIMSSIRWPRRGLGRFLPRSAPTPGCELSIIASFA